MWRYRARRARKYRSDCHRVQCRPRGVPACANRRCAIRRDERGECRDRPDHGTDRDACADHTRADHATAARHHAHTRRDTDIQRADAYRHRHHR